MPAIVMQTVRTVAQQGLLLNAVIQPCQNRGVIAVTLQYPAMAPAHDVTVEIVPFYVRKQVQGDTTYFEIEHESDYEVHLTSAHWSAQIDLEHVAEGLLDHHTTIAIPLVLPTLTLTLQDHHFVPGVEQLRGHYTPRNLAPDTLKLTIVGTNYGGNDIVYERQGVASADGDHPFAGLADWDGIANQGALNGLAVSPLYSPYTVRVEAENTHKHAEAEFYVLYHSVTLALGTYTADGAEPDEGAARGRWVQYKLNQLGYFAGPVDGVIGAQTQRAMVRYALGHPALTVSTAENRGALYIDEGPFRDALRANEQQRTIIQNGALPADDAAARIYVDHNYFYGYLADFGHDTGHVTNDARRLDRFEIPLEATILLMSRDDADGTGHGVAAPRAVGELDIEWLVDEAAEDTSHLADGSDPNIPSLTRAYVDAAILATRAGGRTNCPSTHGGARQAVNPNAGYFRAGADLPPFVSAAAGDVVSTPAYQGGDQKRGRAGILFRGSYIAGDNYRITAHISFRGLPNENLLVTAHRQVRNMAPWDDILRARTGRMTLWRQHRIAAVVSWPAPAAGINWPVVAAEYALAYCELDHGHAVALTAAQIRVRHMDGDPMLPTFEQAVGGYIGSDIRADQNPLNVVWDNNSLFHTNYQPPAQGPTETAREYIRRVGSDADAKLSENFLQIYATAVALFVADRGGIIIHGRWIPAVAATHRKLWGHGSDGNVENFEMGIKCIGLTRGVVVLSHEMFPRYQHRFIVTHEMGHSRFLNHHETGSDPQANVINPASDTPSHHDLRDHNCTMCYPWGIPSRNPRFGTRVSWATASLNHAAFCGKCILKLRGWDVVTAPMPAAS